MGLILKPKVIASWIPYGKIIVKPEIFATIVPPANIERVFADTLRKVSKIEEVKGDTVRRLRVLPTTIFADTVRKISKIETVDGDTLRRIRGQGIEVVNADTARKISKIESVGGDTFRKISKNEVIAGDTRRVITKESEFSGAARSVRYTFGGGRFKEFKEVSTDCTVAQIEMLGRVCAEIVDSQLSKFNVTDEQEYQAGGD